MNCKHLFWNLKKREIDIVNILINIVERNAGFDSENEFDYNIPFYLIDTNLHELAAGLGYLELNEKIIQEIISLLDSIGSTPASIYYEDQRNERHQEKTSFIYKYTLSSFKRVIDKRVYIYLSTTLIKILREDLGLFEKLYNYDRYDLRSKYSMIIYDAFKHKTKTTGTSLTNVLSLDEFVSIVDYDLTTSGSCLNWTKINGNILTRVEKEINDKTNMYFKYSKVKDKLDDGDRTQTHAIKFETTLAPELEATSQYFTNEIVLERKIAYYIERELNRRLKTLKRMSHIKIDDMDNYKFAERKKLAKEKGEFEAKVKIQDWVNWVKTINMGYHGLVVLAGYQNRECVTINNDYKLYDVTTKEILSSSPRDTQIKINSFLEAGGDYGIADVEYVKTFSISYSKG